MMILQRRHRVVGPGILLRRACAILLLLLPAPALADAAAQRDETDIAALAAVDWRLRGTMPGQIAADLGVHGSEVLQPPTDFPAEFALSDITLLQQGRNGGGDHVVAGLLHSIDPAGRFLSLRAEASYRPSPHGGTAIDLVDVSWQLAFADDPVTELYVMPARGLGELDAATIGDYARFRDFVRTRAIPMQPVAGMRGADMRGRDLYAIVVFTRAAIAPDARLSLRIADWPETGGGRAVTARHIIYDGFWRAAITGGEFALDRSQPFWIKALYRPGANRAEELVGLYRSYPH